MNDFSKGYNAYIQGHDFDRYQSPAWIRGWHTAEHDSLTFWYNMSEKERAMQADKDSRS